MAMVADRRTTMGLSDRGICQSLRDWVRLNRVFGTRDDVLDFIRGAEERLDAWEAALKAREEELLELGDTVQPKPQRPWKDPKGPADSSRGAAIVIAHFMYHRGDVPTNQADLKHYAELNGLKFAGKLNRSLSTFLNDVLEELEKPDQTPKTAD